jgi:sporulation protein YlmC with PRC-barrel domain
MLIPIIKLPVYTKQGIYLGKVVNVEIDGDSLFLVRYNVKSSIIFGNILFIHHSQVLEITKKKMIVSDLNILLRSKNIKTQMVEN